MYEEVIFVSASRRSAPRPTKSKQGMARQQAAVRVPVGRVADMSSSRLIVDVWTDAQRFAIALRQTYGVPDGGVVALCCSNRIEWVVAFLAAKANRSPVVLVPPSWPSAAITEAFDALGPVVVVVDDAGLVTCAEVARRRGIRLITVGTASSRSPSVDEMATLIAAVPMPSGGATSIADLLEADAPVGDDVLALCRASHDPPRGVVFDRAGFSAGVRFAGLHHRSQADSAAVTLIAEPLWHWTGLGALLGALVSGATFVVGTDMSAIEASDLIAQHGVTRLIVGPIRFGRWMPHFATVATNPSTVRSVEFVGSRMNPRLVLAARRAFPQATVLDVYGLTEVIGAVGFGTRPDDGLAFRSRRSSEITSVRTFGSPSEDVGELTIDLVGGAARRWPTAAVHESSTAIATGDLAVISGGEFTLVGHQNEAIEVGCELVEPTLVETALCSLREVSEAAVVGVRGAGRSQDVVALVRPYDPTSASLTSAGIRHALADRLPRSALPSRVYVVHEPLPVDALHRIDRSKVRELIAQREAPDRIVAEASTFGRRWLAPLFAGLVIGAGAVAVSTDSSRTAPFPPVPTRVAAEVTTTSLPVSRYPLELTDQFRRSDGPGLTSNDSPLWTLTAPVFAVLDQAAVVESKPGGVAVAMATTQLDRPFAELLVDVPVVRPGSGILFRGSDPGNSYALRASEFLQSWQLVRRQAGSETVVAEYRHVPTGGGTQLRVVADATGFTIEVDGNIVGRTDDDTWADGTVIGLYAQLPEANGSRWDNVRVRARPDS